MAPPAFLDHMRRRWKLPGAMTCKNEAVSDGIAGLVLLNRSECRHLIKTLNQISQKFELF
jgi:hypothetical protein